MRADESRFGDAVLVLTRSPMLAELRELLNTEGFTTYEFDSAKDLEQLRDLKPFAVAVVDESLTRGESAQILEHPCRAHNSAVLRIVLDSARQSRDGASPRAAEEEVVVSPATAEELVFRVKAQMLQLGCAIPRGPEFSGQINMRRGRVTAVFSLKGGVGKSTVAVNLAVGLATESKSRVLLVDADMVAGDVGLLLDLKGRYTLRDICVMGVRDPESLLRMVVPHVSGVSVLLRPNDLNDLAHLNTSIIPDLLPICRQLFDHIVINMSTSIEETNARLLDAADRILVIMTPELPSVQAAQRFFTLGSRIGYTAKTSLVVNRINTGLWTPVLKEEFDVPIIASIVSDGRQVVRAANEGTSLFLMDPNKKHEITRNFARLVEAVIGPNRSAESVRRRPRFWWHRRAA